MALAEAIQRTQVRRKFTKTYTELKKLLANPSSTTIQIKNRFVSLEDKAERLFKLDEVVGKFVVLEEADEKKIQAEFDLAEEYREKFLEARTLYEDRLKPADDIHSVHSVASASSSASNSASKKYRYPKLEFLKFDGNAKNWVGFWGMFEKVHKDDTLDDDERFQLLLQHMVPDSDAWKLVNSFPPSGKNYIKAVDQLKSRFARDEVLIDVYVRELLQLVLHQERNEKTIKLSSFYDKLVTQLQALESLGVTSEKYAAMLYPLVESAIPDDSLMVWERARARLKVDEETGEINLLKELLDFMRVEVESEERRKAARMSFANEQVTESTSKQENPKPESTASTLVSTSASSDRRNCVFCKKSPHEPTNCIAVVDWDLNKKKEVLRKNGYCFSCLKYGHGVSNCRSYIKCLICKNRHYVVMCPTLENSAADEPGNSAHPNKGQVATENSSLLSSVRSQTLLQTLVVRVTVGSQTSLVRAVVDSGSQRSYLKTEMLNDLHAPVLGTELLSHGLFGGVQTASRSHNLYKVGIQGRWNNFKCDIVVLNQDKICSYVPRCENSEYLRLLQEKNITLTDTDFDDLEIKLLLGADVLADIVTSDVRKIEPGLTAVRTKLGWTIMGLVPSTTTTAVNICCTNLNIYQLDHLWRLDVLGIEDPATVKTRKDREEDAVRHFEETVRIDPDHRYVVSLPWIEGHSALLNNRETAIRRLMGTTRRLKALGKREEYDKIFREWEELGIIEKVGQVNSEKAFYLPHHPVLKEASLTTKLRPVFDASARDVRGNSLNACLEKGPNLVNLIPNLIIKFRKREIGVSSDIARAFLQIGVSESDRDFLRFLWWDSSVSKEIVEYRHCRVVFGVTASPFLLGAVISHHLKQVPFEYQETANVLTESWYVDNSVTSVRNEAELETFIRESTEIMKLANFDLRGWVYSGMKDPPEPIVPLLGMKWRLGSDFLFCDAYSLMHQPARLTKRGLLSAAHKLFDPIGFTCPTGLIPKLLIQECWKVNLEWESELPTEIAEKFIAWLQGIEFLHQCSVPRRISFFSDDGETIFSLHAFADASKVAYAACIFLRSERGGLVSVALVQAKARVAPLEAVTIPRLELTAALVASRLCRETREALELQNSKEFLWSDSSAVVTWIKRDESWSVFVANRCREIRTNTNVNDWNHVAGIYNAADLPSRGCHPKALAESKWWEGPEWLLLPEENWPCSDVIVPSPVVDEERRKSTVVSLASSEVKFSDQLNRYFSKFSKIVRCVAWILRFIRKCRKLRAFETSDITFELKMKIATDPGGVELYQAFKIAELSVDEVRVAENRIWKILQDEEPIKNKKRRTLLTFVGEDGVIRVKTKLLSGDFTSSFKTPVLIPDNKPIVQKMIFQMHVNHQHAGALTLLCKLREEYWLVRRMVNQAVSKCVRCKRFKATHAEAPPAPLPEERIRCGPIFSSSGVDLAGPLNLRTGEKAWVVLFTCSTYRAVHFELVTALSTEAFLHALRRFIARRGRVETIFADNGTNFVGAANALNQLDWDKIVTDTSARRIRWKFNPPSSPWWGGWWERLVRVLKELLRRNLGNSCLNYEELYTVLVDCEAVVNDRPLTYVSNENDDLVPLTPSLFLREIVLSDVTDLDILDAKSLNKRVRYLQQLRNNLRHRFQKEYLALLVHRQKRADDSLLEVHVGDIVLVGSDDVKRINWPLAKVLEMFPGRDDHSRVARLKLASGELVRPVQRLFPLEVSSAGVAALQDYGLDSNDEESDSEKDQQEEAAEDIDFLDVDSDQEDAPVYQVTRRGRSVRAPERLDL